MVGGSKLKSEPDCSISKETPRGTLAEDPGSTRPERISQGAAQTRTVSGATFRLDPRKSVRSFKGIICDDISEFESSLSGRVGVKHFQTAPSILVSMPLAGSSLLFGIGTLALLYRGGLVSTTFRLL